MPTSPGYPSYCINRAVWLCSAPDLLDGLHASSPPSSPDVFGQDCCVLEPLPAVVPKSACFVLQLVSLWLFWFFWLSWLF